MAKYSSKFARLKEDQTLEYAQVPLRVATHHHEEWDEEVIDPETGEPTGEVEHKSRDWTTYETKLSPTASEFSQMGFFEVIEVGPKSPAPEGKTWQKTGKYERIEPTSEGQLATLSPVWELVDIPMPTLSDYDNAMEMHMAREREDRGYTTREPDSYLASSNERWAQDAHDWVAHRDAVMEYALSLINAVKAGEAEPPTMHEFQEGLPKIVWTYGGDETTLVPDEMPSDGNDGDEFENNEEMEDEEIA